VHHAGLVQVIDVLPVPGDHALILQARHPLPDEPRRGEGTSRIVLRTV
jgi:hypothetical protein